MRSTKANARELTLLAVCTAVLFGAKEAVSLLPNIEPVTLLLLLYTLIFGRKTLWIIAAFVLLEGLLYGFGMWWPMYVYIWPLWHLAVQLLSRLRPTPLLWACAAGLFGLTFGALCVPAYMVFSGTAGAFGWWIAGIPMDLLHGAGNFVITLALFTPLYRVLTRLVSIPGGSAP